MMMTKYFKTGYPILLLVFFIGGTIVITRGGVFSVVGTLLSGIVFLLLAVDTLYLCAEGSSALEKFASSVARKIKKGEK